MIGFWKFFLENRAFTYFLTFLSVLAGLYAVNVIPKESTPEITIPIAVVQTPFFGASAEDVETLVTAKIEDRIDTLSDVAEFTSTSQTGFSNIVVEFEQNVDIDERVTRLKEAVDGVKGDLPADGNDPVVTKVEFSAQPVLTVSLVSDLPNFSFQKIVDEVEDKIIDVDGVAQVNYFGIPDREIAVLVDNRKLIESGLDFGSIVGALSTANVTRPVGSVVINSIDYPLDLRAEVSSFDELRLAPISNAGASTLLISDIATLSNGYQERENITRVGFPGGETNNSVTINVVKKDGGDITQITREVRELIDSMQDEVLVGVDVVVTYDAGKDIEEDLTGLLSSGMQTVGLVFIILLLAVGFRESIIAAVSIPISFMLAFVAFLVVGNTINFISLFALILSVGILVDTAIVVVEGINAKIQSGKRRQDAAVETIAEYGLPLIAGTMTTVGVFFPLLFLSGITGQFIAGIPYTIIFVLLSSLFVSLAFVTVWCATFLKNRDAVNKETFFNRQFVKLESVYKKVITTLLNNRIARRLFQSGIIVAFFFSIGLVATGLVKVEFFPGGDLEFAFINIEKEAGSSLEQTDEFVMAVEALLSDAEYLDSFVTTIGETSAFSNNDPLVGDQYANITLNVNSDFQSEGPALLEPLREKVLEANLTGVNVTAEAGGPPTGAPVEVSLSSTDTELLRSTAREAERALESITGTVNVDSTLPPNNTGFNLIVDRNAAYRFGVDLNAIATAVVGATDGVEVFEITENGDDTPVIVRNRLDARQTGTQTKEISPERLRQLEVRNNRGETILLGSIIDIRLAEADSEVLRLNGERDITITSDLSEGANGNEIRAEYREILEDIVPEGVSFSFGGEAAEQDQSFAEVSIAFIVGIFLMFSILILQFGKWRQTVIILSVIPFALGGVLLGLFVSGNALSFPAVLGLIALAGIVVNNSIILVSVFNQLRKANPEWSLDRVVTEGAAMRLRPVVLTTVTTIIGVSPLLTQSAIWSPIAYAIIFGLFFCIFVTLAMIPLVYRRLEGFGPNLMQKAGSWLISFVLLLINISWYAMGLPWYAFSGTRPEPLFGDRVIPKGFRTDFAGWLLTVLLLVILPLIVAVMGAVLFSRASGEAQAGLVIFAVLAGIVVYVATHVRKREH